MKNLVNFLQFLHAELSLVFNVDAIIPLVFNNFNIQFQVFARELVNLIDQALEYVFCATNNICDEV